MGTHPYICLLCSRLFRTTQDHSHHLAHVHRTWYCWICSWSQSFTSQSALDTHIAATHPPAPDPPVDLDNVTHPPASEPPVDPEYTAAADAFLADQSANWLDWQREVDAEKAARRGKKNAKAREHRAERKKGGAMGVGSFAMAPGYGAVGKPIAVEGDPYGLRGRFYKGRPNRYAKAKVPEPARVEEERRVEVVDLTGDEEVEALEVETAPVQLSPKVGFVDLTNDEEDKALDAATPPLQPVERGPESPDLDSDPEGRVGDATSDAEDEALDAALWAAFAEVDAESESTLEEGEDSDVGLDSQGEDGFDPSLLHPRWKARR